MNGIPEAPMCEDAPSVNPITSTVREIPLRRGGVALIDDDDYKKIAAFRWNIRKDGYVEYAARYIQINGKNVRISMHRVILNLSHRDGTIVDHINGNGLDNRKTNLRIVTSSLNRYNCRMRYNNTSGYRGISWHRKDKKWRVSICFKGKQFWCGEFINKISAALAYDNAAIKYYGTDAKLNFPKEKL